MGERTCIWVHEFSHNASRVWPMITNSDRVDRLMGLPPILYQAVPRKLGGTYLKIHCRMLGLDIRWDEPPYEWIKEQCMWAERHYPEGPLASLFIKMEIKPREGGCTVVQTFRYTPRGLIGPPLTAFQIGIVVRHAFVKAYGRIKAALAAQKDAPIAEVTRQAFATPADVPKLTPAVKRRISEGLARARVSPELGAKITELLTQWPDMDLIRLRPFALAALWNVDKDAVLTAFLRATQAGLFDLSWDILCPSCRGAKSRNSTLDGLKKQAHCPQCNIRFDAQFDRSVEISFKPSPSVRKVEVAEFCAGSVQNTTHFLIQLRVGVGQSRKAELNLPPGRYRLRSLQSGKRYDIQLESGPAMPPPMRVVFEETHPAEPEVLRTQGSGLSFEVTNRLSEDLYFNLEEGDHFSTACTAAYVTSFQDFRDLFATEVLHVGEELSVGSVAILFTDLKDSTALYSKIGDAKAFALINEHLKILTECIRRNHGAVIKTIGDAVMASFLKPEDALLAAREIQKAVAASPVIAGVGERLSVKIGIHTGPCFVVNLNDRLDYFGTTVNIAARTQSEAEKDGILLTARMIDDPGVKQALRAAGLQTELIVRRLKGVEGETDLFRVIKDW